MPCRKKGGYRFSSSFFKKSYSYHNEAVIGTRDTSGTIRQDGIAVEDRMWLSMLDF
jgi:hypothetical protein